jgi:two-component system response regulator ResD
MSIRVLLAEDDAAIRELLAHHLTRDGIDPIIALDGNHALRVLRSGVDLALLDIGLPGMDGLELVRTIRRENNVTPVMYISARTDEIDRIVGLEIGADDYIVKPFSPREVIARVRALLRRSGDPAPKRPSPLCFGRLAIDPESREARVDGDDIRLKPREFSLLLMFARNHGVALSRDMLIEQVWGYDFDGDVRTVDVHVRRLRARLCGELGLRTPIQTLQGYGYKFTAEK